MERGHFTGKRCHSEVDDSSSDEEQEEASFRRYAQMLSERAKMRRISNPFITVFLHLLEDDVIQDFLWVDSCAKLADRYLIAMAYVYFRRASLPLEQYSRYNFFSALYLANDMEEDDEDEKDELWKRMSFRAAVSKRTCDEVIAMAPGHHIWQRHRLPYHGGATRAYSKPSATSYGRTSPTYCHYCMLARRNARMSPSYAVASETKHDLLDDIEDCANFRDFYHHPCVRVREE